jgi:DNA invertase Pin-like site-specific DNA recombinase
MKIFACYVRVSALEDNQAKQKRDINRWLKENRIDRKNVRWYTDKASGDSVGQPAMEKLRADVAARDVSTVVTWRLDRLSGSMRDGLSLLCDWSMRPLRIVAVAQDVDFKGGAGKAVASVLNGLAEMSLETKREQARLGLETSRATGNLPGRPRISADNAVVQKAKKLYKAGKLSVPEMAEKLNISTTTVRRYVEM